MNHAYVDASYDGGVAGWAAVLIRPGQPPYRVQGRSEMEDNNAAELRAVLEALHSSPAGEPLTVYSDNTSVLRSVRIGSASPAQDEMAARVRAAAAERQIPLRLTREARTQRHMVSAHDLANDARLERESGPPLQFSAEVVIDQAPWRAEAMLRLRRPGERLEVALPLDPAAPLPPTAQALLGAVALAQAGETLLIRRASALAQAIWERPVRALEGPARTRVEGTRAHLAALGATVVFG